MSQRSNTAPQSDTVRMDIGQEVRLAVVMYGGVSLAVYINGVAQELLNLVRATATDPDDVSKPYRQTVRGTEKVYRRLGQILGSETLTRREWSVNDPIRTRFVIDVLSGTSAGGINAIYLAKALANGQSIDRLQDLWVEKGDVAVLLNDCKSLQEKHRQDPPQSLLSGSYMFDELLKALNGMDEATTAAPRSPYTEDLDLFITTTDIRGLPIQLRLSDMVAEEKRHRNVFRFRYRSGHVEEARNDFRADQNTLLAFAARCTSAFPFAFEPAKAVDATTINPGKRHSWDEFFPAYRVPPGVQKNMEGAFWWSERAFGDGGYLDNKPFSYAIDMLGSKHATLPVDRKLIYIEPDPEQIDWREITSDRDRPHAIENVNAALSLARYETIREDLERILSHNRLIERVERILSGMERDISVEERHKAQFAVPDYRHGDLSASIKLYGAAYGGYHRLKVAVLTDELTEIIARAGGFDPESDHFKAIRYIVRSYRKLNYGENQGDAPLTQNEFLFQFDLSYRLRRLEFVLRKIDELWCLNHRTRELLKRWKTEMPSVEEERTLFRSTLERLRTELGKAYITLRRARTAIGESPQVTKAVAATGLDVQTLRNILAGATEETRNANAEALLKNPVLAKGFEGIRTAVAEHVRAASKSAGDTCEALLGSAETCCGEQPVETKVRTIVRAYYASFEKYDQIAYPILYSTEVGNEANPVEVVRISPQDASLVKKPGERKLAGTSLGHFGAFLDRSWRANDILWGRLDGAERLISALLHESGHPNQDQLRMDLVREAHVAILEETFGRANRDQLCQLLADALARGATRGEAPQALRDLVATKTGSTLNLKIEAALRACLHPEELYKFYKNGFHVNLDLDRRATTKILGRATHITGRLLEDIANRERTADRPAVWLARLGMGISALVELALPSGVAGVVGRRLLALLVALGIILFAGGLILAEESIERFGLTALVLTSGVWTLAYLLRDYVARRQGWRRVLSGGAAFIAIVALLLTLLGGYHLPEDLRGIAHRLGLGDKPGQTMSVGQ